MLGLALGLCDLAELFRSLQIDRYQLGHALFGHGDPKQPVDPGHGQPVMGNNQETGAGLFGYVGD